MLERFEVPHSQDGKKKKKSDGIQYTKADAEGKKTKLGAPGFFFAGSGLQGIVVHIVISPYREEKSIQYMKNDKKKWIFGSISMRLEMHPVGSSSLLEFQPL